MGTGYTRNDTANNIADGNVINASDLDGEFDAIQAAFNASTGHSHDGTTGEGPQIGTGGIADNAVTLGTKTSGNYVATGAVSGVGLSGSASAEGATFTVSSNATDANTASTIVARDASGNFSAGTITAALTGTASNAALLDSLDSTQFLRSDAADTKTSGALVFSDNVPLHFGTGSDLRLYHSGTASYIQDYGTGNLFIQANDLRLQDDVGGHYIQGNKSSDVKIYHPADGTVHLATTATGVDVTGTITFDGGTTSADLNFGDNDKAVFGAGSDLQIYHDGSNSYIRDAGVGNLYIQAQTSLVLEDTDGNNYLSATDGGAVYVYYNGSTKLTTKTDGVDITGELQADSLDIDGVADFTGKTTHRGGVSLLDSDVLSLGTSDDLQIYHDGSNSYIDEAGTGGLKINANNSLVIGKYGASESMAVFDTDGAVTLYYDNAAKLATTSSGVTVTGQLNADGLALGDNETAYFGNSGDLQIYHTGSHSFIHDNGTGSLYIDATQLNFRNGAQTQIYADFTSGGAARLAYNGNVKFQTNSGGVTVTGTVTADGVSLGDNEKAQFGASNDLQIYHDGSASRIVDAGGGNLILQSDGLGVRINKGTTENMATFDIDGAVTLYYDGAAKFYTNSTGVDIGGDINAVDNIYIASTMYHEGDTDTYTQFHNANEWRVVTGGTEMLEVNDSYVLLGANSVGKVNTNSVSGSVAPDFYGNNIFVWTLTGNLTLSNPTTEVAGMSGLFVFIHSGAARTVSLGTDYETVGGAGLTLSGTAGATDVVPYTVSASGRILLGTPQLAFA